MLLCEGDTVIMLRVNASSHASTKSLTRRARICLLGLGTTSFTVPENNKDARYGKNRRDDCQSSGGMNPRQQSVPRRHVLGGLDGCKKGGVSAEAAEPRARFMVCKRRRLEVRPKLTPTVLVTCFRHACTAVDPNLVFSRWMGYAPYV
jgi:hypothetical protein